jgi:hypothetical protein
MRSISDIVDGITLTSVRGRVMATQVWSETHVKGSGSGLMVKGFGVGSSKTTSTVVNKREVCIEAQDGLQVIEEFHADKIQLMPDQEVTFIRAARRPTDEPVTVAIHNHSMRKSSMTGKEMFHGIRALLFLSPFATILGGIILIAVSQARYPQDLWFAIGVALLLGNLYWLRGPAIRSGFERRVRSMMGAAAVGKAIQPAAVRSAEGQSQCAPVS